MKKIELFCEKVNELLEEMYAHPESTITLNSSQNTACFHNSAKN